MTDLFGDFLKQVVNDCVNGSSGSVYAKPNLEAPPVGTVCPKCGELVGVVDYCAGCEEGER
jgi:hypothetical protein